MEHVQHNQSILEYAFSRAERFLLIHVEKTKFQKYNVDAAESRPFATIYLHYLQTSQCTRGDNLRLSVIANGNSLAGAELVVHFVSNYSGWLAIGIYNVNIRGAKLQVRCHRMM